MGGTLIQGATLGGIASRSDGKIRNTSVPASLWLFAGDRRLRADHDASAVAALFGAKPAVRPADVSLECEADER
jgi:hypothetical protein